MVTYKIGSKVDPLFEEEKLVTEDGEEGVLLSIRNRPMLTKEQSYELKMDQTTVSIIEEEDTSFRQWKIEQGDQYMGRLKRLNSSSVGDENSETVYELTINGKFYDLYPPSRKIGSGVEAYNNSERKGTLDKKPFSERTAELEDDLPEDEKAGMLLSLLIVSLVK